MKYFILFALIFSTLIAPTTIHAQEISSGELTAANGWSCTGAGMNLGKNCTHTDGRVATCRTVSQGGVPSESCTITTQATASTPTPGGGAPTSPTVPSSAPTPAPATLRSTSQGGSADNFVPLTSIPAIENISSDGGLSGFFNYLYVLAVGAAAVIAVLQFVRAGIMYAVMSTGVVEKREARHLMVVSVMGLLLVLSPALVFGIINPDILSLRLGPSESLDISVPPPSGDRSGMMELCRAQPQNQKFTEYREIVVPNPQTLCIDAIGQGWVSIASVYQPTGTMEGDGACCWGSAAPAEQGSVCCAYDPSQVSTPRPVATGDFTYTAYSIRKHGGTGEWCQDDSYGSKFTEAARCISDVNSVLSRPLTEDIVYVDTIYCSGTTAAPTDTLLTDAALKTKVEARRTAYNQKMTELGGTSRVPWCDSL